MRSSEKYICEISITQLMNYAVSFPQATCTVIFDNYLCLSFTLIQCDDHCRDFSANNNKKVNERVTNKNISIGEFVNQEEVFCPRGSATKVGAKQH